MSNVSAAERLEATAPPKPGLIARVKSTLVQRREASIDPQQHVHEAAASWFGELPVYIQDPIGRGNPNPVVWSSSKSEPEVADLLSIGQDSFTKYTRVLDCLAWLEDDQSIRRN